MSRHLVLIPLSAGEPTIQLDDITEFCVFLHAGEVIHWANNQDYGQRQIADTSKGYALILKDI